MDRLRGKVAVVTGAGNGLGRAHAIALAAQGARVVVNDVGLELALGKGGQGLDTSRPPAPAAQRVVDEIVAAGGEAVADTHDVSSVDAAGAVVQTAVEAFGDVHVVVNNAGTIHDADVDDIDDRRLDADFLVNMRGTAGTTQAAFDVMKANGHGGAIVNTMTGFGGYPAGRLLAAYNAAKYAVVSWTLSTAAAGEALGIRANAYSPIAVTRQARAWFVEHGLLTGTDADAPIIAHLTPEKISPLVVLLASDAAAHLTGRLFVVLPTSIGTDAQYRIQEVFVAATDGAVRDRWTVDELERELPAIARADQRQGAWSSLLGPVTVPAGRDA